MRDAIEARRRRLLEDAPTWTPLHVEGLATRALARRARRQRRNATMLATGTGALVVLLMAGVWRLDAAPHRDLQARVEAWVGPALRDVPSKSAGAMPVATPASPDRRAETAALDRRVTTPAEDAEPSQWIVVGLDEEAEIEALPDSGRRRLALRRGAARFEADAETGTQASRNQTLQVETGDAVITAAHGVFVVEHSVAGAAVIVERGDVTVVRDGVVTVLGAGERIGPEPARRPRTHTAKARDWRALARAGEDDAAADALRHAPTPTSVDHLMLAADVMRRAGRPGAATRYLRAVVDDHRRDAMAPVAAFTLGRLYADALGKPESAAAAFARARALAPRGPLAEHALAREVAAWRRAGQTDKVETKAAEYLRRYPRGRHRARVESRD